ncbi:Aste57867_24505 [Aphanomyces stellatus]|uniref:Aste57867_24505 protein n=1 Tax=Aphanomyces stellatus TaxID=120398 RepID=A0A485LQN6_9STRA|nr:hypothetical protein As57867_024428 [Aphanomyces stellatus]VFU01144.1 Aste57867_24505 [Aphanomyces stellatus]
MNIEALLKNREFSHRNCKSIFTRGPQRQLQAHAALVKRLVCDSVLNKHDGCVNRLCWNQSGTTLASGSDDTRVILWDYNTRTARHVIETGHSMNIFGVCFVPGTNDHIVASGGMDCEVRLHFGPFRPEGSKLVATHRGRVKDVVSSPGVPKVIWSGAEDGLVRQFDTRMLDDRYVSENEEVSPPNVLIDLGRRHLTRGIRVMGMSVHPLDPTKMALACGDHYIRLFDRRMLRAHSLSGWGSDSPTTPVDVFSPPHMHFDAGCDSFTRKQHVNSHSTSVQFNCDGSQLLCSYHSDNIYLFDVQSRGIKSYENAWQNGMRVDELKLLKMAKDEVKVLVREGISYVESRRFSAALSLLQKVSGLLNPEQYEPSFRQSVFRALARAYLGRNWRADAYLALQYCIRAVEIDSGDTASRVLYVKALSQSGRHAACQAEGKKVVAEFPLCADEIHPFLVKPRTDSSDDEDRDDDDEVDDMNEDTDDYFQQDSNDGQAVTTVSSRESLEDDESSSTFGEDDGLNNLMWVSPNINGVSVNTDTLRRYIGYSNIQTDIKEAKFFGIDDSHIVAGSDDGRAYIWEKESGQLVNALQADEDIVNCVQCHPFQPCLATSGIENVVRLWNPLAEVDVSPTAQEMSQMIGENQTQMNRREGERLNIMQNPALFRLLLQAHHEEGVQVCAPS